MGSFSFSIFENYEIGLVELLLYYSLIIHLGDSGFLGTEAGLGILSPITRFKRFSASALKVHN